MGSVQSQKSRDLAEDPDYQFFNAAITQDSVYGNAPTPAAITITRDFPILNHIENFYVSIGRLSYPTNQLPLLTAPLRVGTNYSADQMIYSITLTWGGFTSGQTFATWAPTNFTTARPTGTVTYTLQSDHPYYYCYTFTKFCKMLSNCFTTAFNNLNTASGGTLPIGSVAPVIYWNSESGTTIIKVQIANYDITGGSPILIFFNNELAPLLTNFQFNRIANNDVNGMDNQLIVNNNLDDVDITNTYYLIRPTIFDSSYWCTVASLQLLTSIPINFESITSTNYNYGQVAASGSVPQQNNPNPSSNIITDFVPDFSLISNFGALFIYNKDSTWRYSSVVGSGQLKTFTLSLVWTDVAGRQMPVYLSPNTTCNIKVGFFKKSLLNTRSDEIIEKLERFERHMNK